MPVPQDRQVDHIRRGEARMLDAATFLHHHRGRNVFDVVCFQFLRFSNFSIDPNEIGRNVLAKVLRQLFLFCRRSVSWHFLGGGPNVGRQAGCIEFQRCGIKTGLINAKSSQRVLGIDGPVIKLDGHDRFRIRFNHLIGRQQQTIGLTIGTIKSNRRPTLARVVFLRQILVDQNLGGIPIGLRKNRPGPRQT